MASSPYSAQSLAPLGKPETAPKSMQGMALSGRRRSLETGRASAEKSASRPALSASEMKIEKGSSAGRTLFHQTESASFAAERQASEKTTSPMQTANRSKDRRFFCIGNAPDSVYNTLLLYYCMAHVVQIMQEVAMRKKLGLALGAGSTKGLAHIGVLQVLLENEIPLDMIAGCSMGAIIGSIFAAGSDIYMLEKYVLSMKMREHLDLGNPIGSGGLIRGGRLEELIRIFTHDKCFGETPIPFYCVAVDVASAELRVFDEGKIHRAVRASMSIPGVFTPVQINGRTYVDGGVIERVPCKALRERGADVVVGVDVGYRGGEYDVSGMNAYMLINRSVDIMQWEITKLRGGEEDVLLVPEVLYVKGHFQMDQAREVIAEGRRVATEALPRIRELLK